MKGECIGISDCAVEKLKLSDTRTSLFHTSLLSILVLVAAFASPKDRPDIAFSLMLGFVFMGLYVFVGTVETAILRNLMGLRASLIAWVLLLASLTYVAKAWAVSEINSIFHVDASLLPMTVIATTALQVVDMMFWPVVVVSVFVLVVACLWRDDFVESKDGLTVLVTLLVSVGAQIFFAFMISGWVGSDKQREMVIYRVSHYVDFNSSFRCDGIDESKYSVLFVDPAKTKILVAPKIPEHLIAVRSRLRWLEPVDIPEEFPVLSCSPIPGWQAPDI